MVSVVSLWLPVLLSAMAVFAASSVIHMFLNWHRHDFRQLPQEAQVRAALRPFNIPPGTYMTPFATGMEAMRSPEWQEEMKTGPVAHLTVIPNGMPNMGKALGQWFLYCIFVGVFVAYLTGIAFGPGADYLAVFRVAGTAAFMGYALGHPQDAIWMHQGWGSTLRSMGDGLVYGLLTGGVFGWLWPV